jgi:hypothetical protein
VHVSWNGATGVSSWRVLAGQHAGALQAQVTFADNGFESSTILPKKYAYVRVQALGPAGQQLGSSLTARVLAYTASLGQGGGNGQ